MPIPISRQLSLPTTGLTYHVLEWGSDDPKRDHTVFLLHGFLDLAWGWEQTVAEGLWAATPAAPELHLVAPDLRGHGDSDRVGAGGYYHFADYLADLHDLVSLLGRRRVSLVGHSMGGSIASYYTGTFPERIARLALLEGLGPPESTEGAAERARAWLESWQRVRSRPPRGHASLEEAAERLCRHDPLLPLELARALADKGTRLGPDGRRYFKHDPLHTTSGPYGFQLNVAMSFWRHIACPVLLVEGAESSFRFPAAEAARRRAAFRDVREAVLPGAGHMMQRHQPAALGRLLREFLVAPSAVVPGAAAQ